jgi:beta-lactamase regulating signal transducer with metallopeptidase domain
MRFPLELVTPATTGWLALLLAGAIKATLLLALAWIATSAMRRAPAAARHLIWTLAMVGALGLPLASLLVPAWPLAWVPALTNGAGNVARPATALADLDGAAPPAGSRDLSVQVSAGAATEPAGTSKAYNPPDRRPVTPGAAAPPHAAPVPPGHTAFDPRSLLRFLPLIWLLGALLVLGRRAIAAIRVAGLRRRATPVTDPSWRAALVRHAVSLGIKPVPALLMSDCADVPMTFGTLRPVVLVPAIALGWTAERRDFVLLHELGHIRRRDTLALLIGQLAAALYWFHPLVWVAKRRQRLEAEHACDDQVLLSGALASAYANELLDLATAAHRRDTFGAAALAMARRSQLEGRLLTILDPRHARGSVGWRFVAVALLVTIAATGALAAARPARAKLADCDSPAVTTTVRVATSTATTTATTTTALTTKTRTTTAILADASADGPDLALAPAIADAAPAEAVDPVTVSVSPSSSTSASTSASASVSDASEPVAAAVTSAVLAAAAATSSGKGSSHSSFSIHEDDSQPKTVTGIWNDDGLEARYKSVGEVRFNDALDDVASLGPDGSLVVEEKVNGSWHKAEFKRQAGGIERAYWVDGKRAEWDASARQWMSKFLIETDRRSAMLAKQRYPRLKAAGGPGRVMEEIALMPSDYAKGIYYMMLIDDGLGRDDLRRVVTQAGNDVKSDYELARILSAAADKGALQDDATRSAFVTAIGGIESDYEHARVLMMVLQRPKLDPAVAAVALRSTAQISSDYERGRILVTMAEKGNVATTSQGEYLKAARAIRSDYEKARALRSLVENADIARDNVPALLSAAGSISSDYERAGVLVAIAASVKMDAAGRSAFVDTAQSIGSDYERQRALAALGEHSTTY